MSSLYFRCDVRHTINLKLSNGSGKRSHLVDKDAPVKGMTT